MLVSVVARNASLAMSYGALAGSEAPTNLELALFDGNPDAGGVEVSGGGYVRPVFANDGPAWPDAPADGEITSAAIPFAASTGAWSATADWWQLYDADTGDEWDAMPLSEPISVTGAGVSPAPTLTVKYVPPSLGV